MRATLRSFGPRRATVRAFEEGGLIRVVWYEHGRRRFKSWPAREKREALAWAEGFAEERQRIGSALPAVTLRELWTRYWAAESEQLRPRTQTLYRERWNHWELFVGRDVPAGDVTLELIAKFRAALVRSRAVNQVREILNVARLVFNWGERAGVLRENAFARFRFKQAKDAPRHEPAEYRLVDFERLIAQFDPQNGTQWRAACVLAMLGNQGVRVNAALHLAWDDVDLERGVLTWRARWDKTGREWAQPIRAATHAALLTAQWWRGRAGYQGPWVFFGARKHNVEGIYQVQALWAALQRAEAAAQIPHLALRAAHGLRRMVAGEVLRETGDPVAAAHFIGDRDLRVMGRYLKERFDQLVGIGGALDAAAAPPPALRTVLPKVEKRGRKRVLQSHRSDLNRRPPVSTSTTKEAKADSSAPSGSRNSYPKPEAGPKSARATASKPPSRKRT